MKGYITDYNAELNKFVIEEFESPYGKYDNRTFELAKAVKEKASISYLDDMSSYGSDYNSQSNTVDTLNNKLQPGEVTVILCKTCGKYFWIDADEKEWFAERKLSIPKRCWYCRRHKKSK